MQKCKRCGKEIKYIAININSSVICDTEEKTFYTITGRKVMGYEFHTCQLKEDAECQNVQVMKK